MDVRMRSKLRHTWARAGKMSTARRGQKRLASPPSAAGGGWLERKRSRTSAMQSSNVEEREEMEEGESEEENERFISQVLTQDMDETGEEKPVFTGEVSGALGDTVEVEDVSFVLERGRVRSD